MPGTVLPAGTRGIVIIQLANGAAFFASILACWERELRRCPWTTTLRPKR
jgi:hypothetical protein